MPQIKFYSFFPSGNSHLLIYFITVIIFVFIGIYSRNILTELYRKNVQNRFLCLAESSKVEELQREILSLRKNVHQMHQTIQFLHSKIYKLTPTGVLSHQKQKPFYQDCTMEFCFNYERCRLGSTFHVFFYNTTKFVSHLLESLYYKSYITENPDEACLFVYVSITEDAGNLSELSLPHWNGDGANHMLIHFGINNLNQSFNVPVIKKAIRVQPIFEFNSFRAGFDLVIPLHSLYKERDSWNYIPPLYPLERKLFLSFCGKYLENNSSEDRETNNGTEIFIMDTFRELEKFSSALYFQLDCHSDNLKDNEKWQICSNQTERSNILKNSVFSLIIYTEIFGATFYVRLLEALKNGAVPVIISDTGSLPYHSYIKWDGAVVVFSVNQITDVPSLLSTFTQRDIINMKRQGRHIWQTLLASPEKILNTLIEVIRTRLHLPVLPYAQTVARKLMVRNQENKLSIPNIHTNASFYELNGHDTLQLLSMPLSATTFTHPNLGMGRSWPKEKFTVLMLTYNRVNILSSILLEYKNIPFLDRIVIVWNNPNSSTDSLKLPNIGVSIYVVANGKNSLNNRFLPYDVIQTDAIFSTDDDITIGREEIILGFRIWRENRDRIVGFPGRYHKQQKGKWIYLGDYKSCGLSLVLTGAAFIHKHYTYLYTYIMPKAIRDKVDSYMNCEDLAMNFLVAHVTRKPPIKVTSKFFYPCKFCPKSGLSLQKGHGKEREDCMNFFTKVYGYMPLIYTQFEADFQRPVREYNSRCYSTI